MESQGRAFEKTAERDKLEISELQAKVKDQEHQLVSMNASVNA